MKIAFFSNFLNHHQLPLCQEFLNQKDVEFVFVACQKISEERLQMGYKNMNEYPFVLRAYEDQKTAMEIAVTYDVVVLGDAPVRYLEARMKKNLLTFRFAERSFKKGLWRRFIPRTRKKIQEGYTDYKNKNLYILGASAYTAHDLVICGFNKEKCFKWGYFPKVEEKNLDELFNLKNENKVPRILYAGRLLPLKHVMDTVKAVHNLVLQGKNVHFTIIGDGESKQEIVEYIKDNKLTEQIKILPFMSPEKVREHMDESDIYVFGSNFYEGWGAVVNEAMNSACAVVVSHSVGSAAFLINHKKNGFIYEFANVDMLTQRLCELVDNSVLRRQLGTEAYKTVQSLWSAENAVNRFCKLCNILSENKEYRDLYKNGPCSLAPIYKNNWFKSNF